MKKFFSYTYKISDIYKLNYALTSYYLIQFILIIFIAKNYTLPNSTSYITTDQLLVKAYGSNILSPATSHLFDVNIKLLIIILLIFSILIYTWLATKYRSHYGKNLKHRINPVRWVQTGISNGLMLVIVGMLGGIYDLSTLGVILVLPIIANSILLIEEKHSDQTPNTISGWFILSLITLTIPILIILCYIISADIYGIKGIGTYYYFLYGTVILIYLASYINQFLRVKKFTLWPNIFIANRFLCY
jgi:hypothetical protein